jgi:hypothetical protein
MIINMELYRVQFRKSRLENEQEQAAKAAKTKIKAEADAKATRDNTPIQRCHTICWVEGKRKNGRTKSIREI